MSTFTSVPLDTMRKTLLREAANVQGAAIERPEDPQLALAVQALTHAGLLVASAETLLRDVTP